MRSDAVVRPRTRWFVYLRFFPDFCDSALAAADLAAFEDFGLESTLPAADAADLPV